MLWRQFAGAWGETGAMEAVTATMVHVLGSMGEGRDDGSVRCLAVHTTFVF
jgi:hypothetical protein